MKAYIDNMHSVLPELRTFEIPDFSELCDRGSQIRQPQSFQGERVDDQVIVLHTSGSTGHPKPIYHTNGSINTVAALRDFPSPAGRRNITHEFLLSDAALLIVMPFFHIMGQTMLWRSLLCRAPLIILSPQKPPTSEVVIRAIKQLRPPLVFFPPSILEDIADAPGGLEAIRLLDSVYFAGAPLATSVGQQLISCVNVFNMHGSTETGICIGRVPTDKNDWQYFEVIPASGITMQLDSSGLYEMVMMRTDGSEKYQSVFHIFPEIAEWRTRDLFERHPEKNDLWLYQGRKDDLLVLSNGEKFNPLGFEKLVERHRMVKGALVVGQGRFQTGLLIEPDWTAIEPTQTSPELVDAVWPTIESANAASPAYGKVWKSKIAIGARDKPFMRAPKGSIVRRQTVDIYEAEIEALYRVEPNDNDLGHLSPHADMGTIKDFLRQAFKLNEIKVPDSFADDDNFFEWGIDSLQLLALSHTLNRAMDRGMGFTIFSQDFHNNSSISDMAKFIHGRTHMR